jgi:hypothetical protein
LRLVGLHTGEPPLRLDEEPGGGTRLLVIGAVWDDLDDESVVPVDDEGVESEDGELGAGPGVDSRFDVADPEEPETPAPVPVSSPVVLAEEPARAEVSKRT